MPQTPARPRPRRRSPPPRLAPSLLLLAPKLLLLLLLLLALIAAPTTARVEIVTENPSPFVAVDPDAPKFVVGLYDDGAPREACLLASL